MVVFFVQLHFTTRVRYGFLSVQLNYTIRLEKYSLQVLNTQCHGLKNYIIQHNKIIVTSDGKYQIDGYIEFEVMGVKYKTLIECKHYKRRIEREIVQTLYDKLRATGTQKGILISTSNFQTGSIQYATEHGIALIQLTESGNHCVTRSLNMITNRAGITPSNFGSPYVGVLLRSKKQGLITCSYLTFLRDGLKPFLLDEE